MNLANICLSNGIGYMMCQIQDLLNAAIPVLITLGVVYFVGGVVQYMIGGGEEAKQKGRDRIIYGIIGLAVITSLWGLVNVVVTTFPLRGARVYVPTLVPITNGIDDGSCTLDNDPKFQQVLGYGTCIINNSIIPFIFAIAVVMFIWGGINFFILNADEEAKRTQGKQFMIWGIIALAVMVTFWGLVSILGNTFGVGGDILPQVCPPGDTSCQR